MNIPSPSTYTNTMKLPNVCSIPALTDIDPFAPFEFHFPSDDLWWDLSDLSSTEPEDNDLSDDLDISFSSSYYQILPDPNFTDDEDNASDEEDDGIDDEVEDEYESNNMKNEVDVFSDCFIDKVLSAISHTCPALKYKRRKSASKRRRKRRQRKLTTTENIEPELKALWLNVNTVGDLFAPSAVSSKNLPPCSLPTIDLIKVNKQMLRRLPDVVYLPVHSCSPDPGFYERNVPFGVHGTLTSKFWKENPFGRLPAIRTNMGPVSPPTDACYGYVWTDDGWQVKAEDPRVPDPGGGHGRG